MYLPYLRGKQFELLALRTFAQAHPGCMNITPIIEPVKQNTKALEQAFNVMFENHQKFAVILNPHDGDFRHPINNDILDLCPFLKDKMEWIPVYLYRQSSDILGHATLHDLSDIMVVFNHSIDFENTEIANLLEDELVKYVVVTNGSRSIRSKLRRLQKNIISLEDRFTTRQKNADYANPDDEFFSDDFAFYSDDNLWGYSDYTTISKDFIEGGMLPYAIAIHLTYKKNDEEINVHHFVSDSNYDQSNIKGKFVEAASKIEPFYNMNNLKRTTSVEELIQKSRSYEDYPGLGYLKKLSILNHLELIYRLAQ